MYKNMNLVLLVLLAVTLLSLLQDNTRNTTISSTGGFAGSGFISGMISSQEENIASPCVAVNLLTNLRRRFPTISANLNYDQQLNTLNQFVTPIITNTPFTNQVVPTSNYETAILTNICNEAKEYANDAIAIRDAFTRRNACPNDPNRNNIISKANTIIQNIFAFTQMSPLRSVC
jgi:hypothetical protein